MSESEKEFNKSSDELYYEFLKYLGAISLSFATLERAVVRAICLTIGGTDWSAGFIVTDQMSYRATVDLLAKLASKKLPPQFASAVNDLIPNLRKAGKDRNRIIHSTIAIVPSFNEELVFIPVRRSNQPSERLSLRTFKGKLLRLQKTRSELESLNAKMLSYFKRM